jgi:hypothetical protein
MILIVFQTRTKILRYSTSGSPCSHNSLAHMYRTRFAGRYLIWESIDLPLGFEGVGTTACVNSILLRDAALDAQSVTAQQQIICQSTCGLTEEILL